MRLIDADAFVQWLLRLHGIVSKNYIAQMLDETPTVDAEPVVRCKDCEHSYEDIVYVGGVATCGRCCSYGTCCDSPVDDDFFCRDGKRKEDANATD